MDRFFELKLFVEVVKAESVSGAAKRMNVAKSVVSRGLKLLEARLGTTLITRTTRRQNLTEAGHTFYHHCVNILADIELAEDSIAERQGTLRGHLRIAAPQYFGHAYVTPAVIDFMAIHPDLLVEVDFSDRRVDLVREGFDLAVRLGQLDDSTLHARRLCRIGTVVCASPAYLKRMGVPRTVDDMATHQCIRYNQVAQPHTWHYRDADQRLGEVRVPIRALSDSSEFMRDAALAGFGIILAPDFLVRNLLKEGSLVSILDDYEWHEGIPEIFAHVVYPSMSRMPRRSRLFTEFLVDCLSGHFGVAPIPPH